MSSNECHEAQSKELLDFVEELYGPENTLCSRTDNLARKPSKMFRGAIQFAHDSSREPLGDDHGWHISGGMTLRSITLGWSRDIPEL